MNLFCVKYNFNPTAYSRLIRGIYYSNYRMIFSLKKKMIFRTHSFDYITSSSDGIVWGSIRGKKFII